MLIFTIDLWSSLLFVLCGVVIVGCIREIQCCVVPGILVTIPSFVKCYGIRKAYWLSVFVPFKLSLACLNVEFKLVFSVLITNFMI